MTKHRLTALAALVAGALMTGTALLWLGARVNGAIDAARAVDGDPMAWLVGDAAALVATLAPALLCAVGLVAIVLGYRRIVMPGPEVPPHTYAEHPSFLRQGQGPVGG